MQPAPPQYPGGMYYPQQLEGMLTKRNVFFLNGIGLLAVWLAAIIGLASGDINARGLARFLAISGGTIGAMASLAGALGSKRTSDMQNLGLLVWAGLLLTVSVSVLAWVR